MALLAYTAGPNAGQLLNQVEALAGGPRLNLIASTGLALADRSEPASEQNAQRPQFALMPSARVDNQTSRAFQVNGSEANAAVRYTVNVPYTAFK